MWPSRWFTPISGTPVANAIDFAAAMPTSSAPISPGPTVTATPSRSPNPTPAASRASSSSGVNASTCARLATSGTTPPNRSCSATCVAMRFERTSRSSTTATAVSAHDVSIPRTFIANRARRSGVRADRLGDGPHQLGELRAVRRRADLVEPHDQCVLVDLLVVVLANADRSEAEPRVDALRRPVRHPHLERDRVGAHVDTGEDQVVQDPAPDPRALVHRVDGDVRDVRLLAVADHAAVADDVTIDPRDEVAPVARLGHL